MRPSLLLVCAAGATLLVALPSAVGAISESALDALVAVFP